MKNGCSQESKVISFWETGWKDAKELSWNRAIRSSFLQVSFVNWFWNHWNCAWLKLSVKQFFTSEPHADLFISWAKERQGAECAWFPSRERTWVPGAVSPPLLIGVFCYCYLSSWTGTFLFFLLWDKTGVKCIQWPEMSSLWHSSGKFHLRFRNLLLCLCLWSEVDWVLDRAWWRFQYMEEQMLCSLRVALWLNYFILLS